jgi:DNA oxidative demethylase
MTLPLFPDDVLGAPPRKVVALGPEAFVLPGLALPVAERLVLAIQAIDRDAPFRHMQTAGGYTMSVALTSAGKYGWTSDDRGYRYTERDPLTDKPWPALPEVFLEVAHSAAERAGFPNFAPDSCLINRYVSGSRLSLHQDKNERYFDAPIVSVSLGIPAVFLFGGLSRGTRPERVPLLHGDVVVWGGVDRLRYHGILPLKPATHPLVGETRLNLTLRKAG